MTAQSAAATGRVSVVTVTYNSAAVLRQSLPALRAYPHVWVVDNASTDDSVRVVRELLPQAHILESRENLGFGRANNLALDKVETPFALLLNPDCALDEGALDALLGAADRYPEAALLSARLYNPSGKSERSYGRAFYAEDDRAPLIEPAGDLCADFLVGTGLLLRMAAMRQVGFFDPAIFLYHEDSEICLRARAAGHALVLVHAARAMHLGGKSSPPSAARTFRRYFYETQSRLYLLAKYRGPAAARKEGFALAAGSLLKVALYAIALNRTLMIRSAARIAAVLRPPRGNDS